MALVLDWQKKLGYSRNPFEGRSAPKNLVGLAPLQERLNLFLIKEERFGTISGEPGTGKTALLEWMNSELSPQRSHLQHLLDAKEHRREHIVTTLLQAHLSFFERRFGGILKAPSAEREKALLERLCKEKKNVLLIDDAGSLGKHELDLLTDLSLKTPTYIILADTKEHLKRLALPEPLIDKLKLEMPEYSDEQLTELLQTHIVAAGGRGTHPFDEYELQGLIKRSGRNPVKLLQLAQERAIELALKMDAGAQPAAAAPHSPHSPAKPGKFFSITIEKKHAGHAHHAKHTAPSDAPASTPDGTPSEQLQDTAAKQSSAPAQSADLSAIAQAVDPELTDAKPAPKATQPVRQANPREETIPADLVEEVISKIPATARRPAKDAKTSRIVKKGQAPKRILKKTTQAHRR